MQIAGRIIALVMLAAMAAGCSSNPLPATAGAVCEIFQEPGFAVRGRARKDQIWIDQTTEAGIAACGWQRPRAIAR